MLKSSDLCPEHLAGEQDASFQADISFYHRHLDEFQVVSCPACQSNLPSSSFVKEGLVYLNCSICSTIYMNPRPSQSLMNRFYEQSQNYQIWAEKIFPQTDQTRIEKLHLPRLERIKHLARLFGLSKPSLLEVGPGYGSFAYEALQSNFFSTVSVVEPTPPLADACRRRGLNVLSLPIEELNCDHYSFDIIVAFEMIEHLHSPHLFISKAHNLLPPGGLLLLTCPNSQGLDIIQLQQHSPSVDCEHVNLFNIDSLSLLLQSHDFSVVHSETPGQLDCEYIRKAALDGKISVDAMTQHLLIDNWDTMAEPFQKFLANNRLSSHMWILAQRS